MQNTLDDQYKAILGSILANGSESDDRTGTGTKKVFFRTIRHNMESGFPLLTTKRVAFKTMVTELKWFLRGDTNIKYLVDNNCHIWNGDAYKAYKSRYGYDDIDAPLSMGEFITKIKTDNDFAAKWGNLGPIYGEQWRRATAFGGSVDQLADLIKGLKENPNSRRHIVSSWNLGELKYMVLPPCHYGFQCVVTSDDRLNLVWNQRSVDTALGLPFNLSSYGLLLLLLCEETGYKPGELVGSLADVHLYKDHLEPIKVQLEREARPLPTVKLSNTENWLNGEFDVELIGYDPHPAIKMPLSN
jgi:thymidylate synthase